MSRLVVIAPHLDDAVLSVGEAISLASEPIILTVFAGVPPPSVVTPYDTACGFDRSVDAMRTRHREHEEACAMLGADGLQLTYLDQQYGPRATTDVELVNGLVRCLGTLRPDTVLIPLGVGHPDHELLGNLCLSVVARCPEIAEVLVYEDLPYRVTYPGRAVGLVTERELTDLVCLASSDSLKPKLAAIAAYSSQMSDEIERCAQVPERLWRWR